MNLVTYVSTVLEDIKQRGDDAILHYAQKWDHFQRKTFEIPDSTKERCVEFLDSSIKQIIDMAANRIKQYAQYQKESMQEFSYTSDGITLGQKLLPIDSVGCYIPGGRYPLISTALMTIIPAKVAGVKEIIVCSPKISDLLIGICQFLGVSRIFDLGGVQAIGAMAYPNNSIPQVSKIVGPGNQFVTMAKKIVFGDVGIDFIAGPSEILIIADSSAIPKYIAADLLAQAEHDPHAIVRLICVKTDLRSQVITEIESFAEELSTKSITSESIRYELFEFVDQAFEAIQMANDYAPEHLELMVQNPNNYQNLLVNYGSLFIGNFAAEVFGDYCVGTNHVLPTGKASKYTGGLHVSNFMKVVSFQQILDPKSTNYQEICTISSQMAAIEGLFAHKLAADLRKME